MREKGKGNILEGGLRPPHCASKSRLADNGGAGTAGENW